MKIRNKSDSLQIITWIPSFQANEERVVTKEEAELLLRNPFFEEVKSKKKEEV